MTGSLDVSSPTAGDDLTDLTRRFYDDVWNAGRYEVATELFHPDFHYVATPGLRGPEAKLAAIRRYRTSCPDLHIHIDDMIVQDDRVAVRWTVTGTDSDGISGMPPTGRSFTAWGVEFLGFRDRRIISDWVGHDWLDIFIQLDVVADPWRQRAP